MSLDVPISVGIVWQRRKREVECLKKEHFSSYGDMHYKASISSVQLVLMLSISSLQLRTTEVSQGTRKERRCFGTAALTNLIEM